MTRPAAALIALAVAAAPAAAQTHTWTSFANGNWNAAGNWDAGVPPSSATTDLVFPGLLDAAYTATNNLASPFNLRSLTVANEAGGVLTVANSGANVLNFPAAGGGITVTGSGPATVQGGTVRLNGPTTVGGGGSGLLTIASVLANTGPLVIDRAPLNFAGVTALSGGNTFTGGITLQRGALQVANNLSVGTGTLTVTTTGVGLDATGDLRAAAASNVPVAVTVAAGATLNARGVETLVFNLSVNGAGGLNAGTPQVTSNVILERASAYAGRTDVTRGNFTLRGTAGALTGSTAIELARNSTLNLDSNANTSGAGNVRGNHAAQDRVRDDAVLTLHRSNVDVIGFANATTTETLGTVRGDGFNIFDVTAQLGAGAVLTVSNLVRVERATFDFRGTSLGTAAAGTANRANVILTQLNGAAAAAALVGGGGAAGSTTISVVPYLVGGLTPDTNGESFLTHGPNGLRPLDLTTEYASRLPAAPYLPGAANNVRTVSPPVLLGPTATVNALLVDGVRSGVYGPGGFTGRLNVTSGGVINAANSGFLAVAEIHFGGAEAVVHATASVLASSALRGANGLTVGGLNSLILTNPANEIAGPVTLNFAPLVLADPAVLGGAPRIDFHGGILTFANAATGAADILSTPLTVGPAGALVRSRPFGLSETGGSQVLTLTGPLTGTGPLQINSNGLLEPSGAGTVVLAGNAAGFSGPVMAVGGVLQFDADARLGSNPHLMLGAETAGTPATLHPTATTATARTVHLSGTAFVRADAGVTYTLNGPVTGATAETDLVKVGAGELVLTRPATHAGQTRVGDPIVTLDAGGALTLRDQGALLNTSAVGVAGGSALVLDNTGAANLSNRLNNVAVNLEGGRLVLRGSAAAASRELAGPLTPSVDTGSVVEVIPGAGQTAALTFSGPATGGFVRANGSTVTLRAPGLGGGGPGAGQINFVHNVAAPTGPALTGGVLGHVFGEDAATSAVGLVTVDVVPPGGGQPQTYRSRLLTPAEYVADAFPNSGAVTTNHRLTAAAAPTGSPTVNALFVDAGGSLAVAAGQTVTLTSGTLLLAGGAGVAGGTLAAAANGDLSIYAGPGAAATLGSSIALGAANRALTKTGPGTLTLTAPLAGPVATPPAQLNVQNGTFRLGAGGSLPAATAVILAHGATLDLNGPGAAVTVGNLLGLGTVQLGAAAGTVLRVNGNFSIFAGTLAGTGTLEKAGAGTLFLSHTADVPGPLSVTGGTLAFGLLAGPRIPLAAGGAVTAAAGTTVEVNNVQQFARNLTLTGAGTVNLTNLGGGSTRFTGSIAVPAGATLAVNNTQSGLWRFSGPISGGGAVRYTNAAVVIDTAHAYTGGTTFAAGGAMAVGVAHNDAFGTGPITVAAPVNLLAVGGNRTVANPLSVGAIVNYGTGQPFHQAHDLTFAGPVTLTANAIVQTIAAGRLTWTDVGGAFNLLKGDGGTLALAGANNAYTGTTNLAGGTLLVTGTLAAGGAVSVADRAILGGGGAINRAVTVNSGGAVAPGVSPGTLTLGAGLTLAAGSIYSWELAANTTAGAGTSWDRLALTGGDLSVAAGAALVPQFLGTATLPNAADAFWQSPQRWNNVIDLTGPATNTSGGVAFAIDNTAWAALGGFATAPALAGRGVDLVWTPVPEPGLILSVCAAAAGAAGWWRRRRLTPCRRPG